ncbi:hypothetical protein DENIS_2088 [Desulfonema ishimotonii]|uniref:Uncharacterized protein n=1 Tax=Desulfonema ishimotonii TaxID=45657 RepID=A0A401FVY9_9BACT|nr:hypothetical protein [Desulfonema ishimotonii]GBC61128.1 hypothetical protein DENIS_2088 [Desulfonema ishimotonii]
MGTGHSEVIPVEKIREILRHIESESDWSDQRAYCEICETPGQIICQTPVGQVCVACAEQALRHLVSQEKIGEWDYPRLKEALSPAARLSDKLTVLWRFDEVVQLAAIRDISEPEADAFISAVFLNMGYVSRNPLSEAVRQAAVDALISFGEVILPLLLKMRFRNPWQLFANTVLVAGTVAPANPDVRKLLAKAAVHDNPEVRKRVISAIYTDDARWANTLLLRLSTDKDPSVRDFYKTVIISSRKERKKKPTQPPAFLIKKEEMIKPGIAEIIKDAYTAKALRELFPLYLRPFADESDLKMSGKFSVHKMTKSQLTRICAKIFSDRTRFEKFLSLFPGEVMQILHIVVWEGGRHTAEKFKNMFGAEVVTFPKQEKDRYRYTSGEIGTPYRLFQLHEEYAHYGDYDDLSRYHLSLEKDVRKLFMEYLSPPRDYRINPLSQIEKTAVLFEDRDWAAAHMPLLQEFVRQGGVRYSKSGKKILIGSLKQMASSCGIREFYDSGDNETLYMRTRFFADFFSKTDNTPVRTVKSFRELLNQALFGQSLKYRLRNLLYHLSGMVHVEKGYYEQSHADNERMVRHAFLKLMKALPLGQWVSGENIVRYCRYRSDDFRIIDEHAARNYLYFKQFYENDEFRYTREERVDIKSACYNDALLTPFVKAMMFLMGNFGLLDIACDPPENDLFRDKNKAWLSVFDGLKYVRLTGLGAYVVGLSPDYDLKVSTETAGVVLDDHRLIINLEGRDAVKSLVLEKIGDRLSDTCFKVSYQSFLRGCRSEADILEKATLFSEQISADPPHIWKDFLKEITDKINPLSARKGVKLYKLKPDDALISLMATDPVLKRYILKAENYHVAIETKHLKNVRERLAAFGYFIDNL